MAQPYVGEIRLFAGTFAPAGWAFCDGQPLAISENETLFQLIGTTYGGDGQSTFNLPDLRGRTPLHLGNGPDGLTYQLAESSGVEEVTLTTQQIPIHSHPLLASTSLGTQNSPSGSVLSQGPSITAYLNDSAGANMAPNAIGPVGGSQPHDNLQPYLGLNYILSLFGLFPSQT